MPAVMPAFKTMPPLASADDVFRSAFRINRAIEQLQKSFFNFCPGETWTPPVNLYETESEYVLCVDLAGVEKDKIDLSIEAGILRLRGRRSVPRWPEVPGEAPPQHLRVHLMEIDHGPFSRSIELPRDVDSSRITAVHNNGLLWIRLPKK